MRYTAEFSRIAPLSENHLRVVFSFVGFMKFLKNKIEFQGW